MGAIHELREEYRFYQVQHPEYRWLFLIVDVASLLLKLAFFGGLLFLCWYIVSRGPEAGTFNTSGVRKADPVVQTAEPVAPALTDERIALLRQIAGQGAGDGSVKRNEATSGDALIGLVAPSSLPGSGREIQIPAADIPDSSVKMAYVDDQSHQTVVKVETGEGTATSTYIEDDIPTVYDTPFDTHENAFADNVYIPADTKNGNWVLSQDAEDFTLQLALTSNVEFLVDFARRLPAEYPAAIYPEKQNKHGKIQYSLSAGSFPSKPQAAAALATFPKLLKRYGAHVRSFDDIHSNTSEFLR